MTPIASVRVTRTTLLLFLCLAPLRLAAQEPVAGPPPAWSWSADANVFAAVADATLMVLQWGRTRRQVFLFGINEITKFGGRVDGVILSKVDTRKQAYYGYGDAQAYTGKAAKAYHG